MQGAAAAASRGRPPPSPFRLRSVPWVSSRCPPLPSRAFGSSNRALKHLFAELRRALLYYGHGAAVWTRRRPARSPQLSHSRPFTDQRPGLEHTPVRGFLLKSPPCFCFLNPRSKAYTWNAFSCFESVNHHGLAHNTFLVITKLRLSFYRP